MSIGKYTSCKDCVFAQYEGDEQVDCRLGRLENYRKQEVNIIPAITEDNTTKFFVVSGTHCSMHRHKDAEKNQKYLLMTPEEVYKDNHLKFGLIVLFNEGNLDALDKTIESLKDMVASGNVSPHQVFFDGGKLRSLKACNDYIWDRLGNTVTWRIMQYTDKVGVHERVNTSFGRMDKATAYYAIFHAGTSLPKNYFEFVNKFVQMDMNKLVAIEPNKPYQDGGNGYLFHAGITRRPGFGGHQTVEYLADSKYYTEDIEPPEDEAAHFALFKKALMDPIDKLKHIAPSSTPYIFPVCEFFPELV